MKFIDNRKTNNLVSPLRLLPNGTTFIVDGDIYLVCEDSQSRCKIVCFADNLIQPVEEFEENQGGTFDFEIVENVALVVDKDK